MIRLAPRLAVVLVVVFASLTVAPGARAATARAEPPSGPPGTTFAIFVSGLPPASRYTCQFFGPDGDGEGLGPCFGEANSRGEAAQTFTATEGYTAAGTHTVRFYSNAGVVLAAATFAVVLPQQRCFPETGQCIQGRFLRYWYERGALFFNGYPLTGEFTEVLENGNPYTVQYFERVRLEYHPENPPPHDILLGQFGRRIHPADPPVPQKANATYFPETGHNVEGAFRSFLVGVTSETPIGLEYFGYPISERFRERLEDGNSYLVQYFERARLEEHSGGRVLLGQFGRRFLPGQPPAPPAPIGPGWIDRQPIPNWNVAGASLPAAPPVTSPRESFCPPLKQGTTPELRAVIGAGWQVPDNPTTRGDVVVVLGAAGADGMCRPVEYQVFVFAAGRFAGTLSPVLMAARTDEAFSSATISADGREVQAVYVRYYGTEALCCPSRISTVTFSLDPAVPLVTPKSVVTVPAPTR